MPSINFFTPVVYNKETNGTVSTIDFITSKVDDYFYLGGKKAYVIQGKTKDGKEKVFLFKGNPSFLATAIKIASYLTILIPLIFLLFKAVLRSKHSFHLINEKVELESGYKNCYQTCNNSLVVDETPQQLRNLIFIQTSETINEPKIVETQYWKNPKQDTKFQSLLIGYTADEWKITYDDVYSDFQAYLFDDKRFYPEFLKQHKNNRTPKEIQ